MRRTLTRRSFLERSGRSATLGTALLATAASPRAGLGAAGANERVRLAWIGCGGRGRHLRGLFARMPDVQVVAGCDVHRARAEAFHNDAGGGVDICTDYRDILDRRDIDAVIVATVGHWHCLPTIHACQAGKDVFVEKPLAWCITEGRRMVEAARKYDRIVMIGTQQRGMPHYQEAMDYIHSGKLGRITEVRTWNLENWAPDGFGNPADADPPADLDWDLWLGPAPKAPYNPNRFIHHYWFWDYGGGWQSEWAIHMNDIVHWAMAVDSPLSACASGGKWARRDNTELPDTLEVTYDYPGFVHLYSFRHGNARPHEDVWYGNAFYGENGTLVINRELGWRVYPEPVQIHHPELRHEMRSEAVSRPGSRTGGDDPSFQREFLDCVKEHRRSKMADVEQGHLSTVPGHLANISFRTGRKVHWDAKTETVRDDPEANRLLGREYRAPWKLEV